MSSAHQASSASAATAEGIDSLCAPPHLPSPNLLSPLLHLRHAPFIAANPAPPALPAPPARRRATTAALAHCHSRGLLGSRAPAIGGLRRTCLRRLLPVEN